VRGRQSRFTLSVVLPVLNESRMLREFFAELSNYIESRLQSESVEVIIINNGSNDDTGKVATELIETNKAGRIELSYFEYAWSDYSEAVRRGVIEAKGEYIAWLGVDIEDMACLVRGLNVLKGTGADMVVLSKYRGADWRPARRICMNRAYNFCVRILDGLWFSDIEGYMIISHRIKPLFHFLGFSRANTLNLNLLFFGKRLGLSIKEAPFYVAEKRKSVFLKKLPKIVALDLVSAVRVHSRFKQFQEAIPHRNTSLRES
jgi:glycosyltransferase involved in cell wall biosynthesis